MGVAVEVSFVDMDYAMLHPCRFLDRSTKLLALNCPSLRTDSSAVAAVASAAAASAVAEIVVVAALHS